eukprot:TRINITY_DN4622_c0_g1_i1.p1 TRINITY_DN4622_c0_g1~~TRINITY_DN4622_c0_g1_i1.p1  ORF type:complete len:134 (-),score=29.53 TRINITY_DN4622_c0_g1_i1:37-438(-)
MAINMKHLMLCSALFVVGFALNILACTIKTGDRGANWILFLVIIMYFFTPIPNFMCGMCNRPDPFGDGNRGWKNSGFFLTAILIVSGIGFPLILLHAKVIDVGNMIMSLAGGVVIYGTVILYAHFFSVKEEEF